MTANHPLRTWRTQVGLSIDQLGRLLGVDAATIAKYELGYRFPRPDILARIESVTLHAVTASDFLPALPPKVRASLEMTTPDPSFSHEVCP